MDERLDPGVTLPCPDGHRRSIWCGEAMKGFTDLADPRANETVSANARPGGPRFPGAVLAA
ncbi:hypothetical protein ACE1SV_65350 [Streptomyces sennicomposti]